MKTNYFNLLVVALMCVTTNFGQSPNVLFDGDFSQTTEIIQVDSLTPPISTWAYITLNGSEANPVVVDGVCNFEILSLGYSYSTWEVQLAQWGFPLNEGHSYRLSFDVRADADRSFGVFLGENEGDWTSLIGYGRYWYDATTEWQTIQIDFEALVVYDLHKLSFELGSDTTTTYFDNILLIDLGPAVPTSVSLWGSLQDELGCDYDYNGECELSALSFNMDSGLWEGNFTLPAGCYSYWVKEDYVYNEILYGENGIEGGNEIQLYLPSDAEITFTYDPTSHLISSTPYSGAPQEVTKVSLLGSLQDELGCFYDYEYDCDMVALLFNPATGLWEGSFTLPVGCYSFLVKETFGCYIAIYGEDGIEGGPEIPFYVSSDAEISFSYDPVSHSINIDPFTPQEVTGVSLYGTLQDELGCFYDYQFDCDSPALVFNDLTGRWEGSFNLPAGCYNYFVKETSVCNEGLYGEDGNEIQLYLPQEAEITFSYDPNIHTMISNPYSGVPSEVTAVSLVGTLQDELGCDYDYTIDCEESELAYNTESNVWTGSFVLPAGCYSYYVRESFGCDNYFYGENGNEYGNEIQLYVPSDGEITFSYDAQTHLVSSTPYSGFPQEPISVSLYGTLQDELGCSFDYEYECDSPGLEFNPDSETWEGSYLLPAGCYSFQVKETSVCNAAFYGENGMEGGSEIQIYIPSGVEVTFSYDPQTHMLTYTPDNGIPQEITSVSLIGSLQSELGCSSDYDYECNNPTLEYDPVSEQWTGKFTLSTGCYDYGVKEISACNVNFYGENGMNGGTFIKFFVPVDGEITFSYDPQTHLVYTSPYSGVPEETTTVSLIGDLQDELGCASDHNYECDKPALAFNPNSGAWEGKFLIPEGCYTFQVKETVACVPNFYGENGTEWGIIQLYVPSDSEITFSYDPQTHILNSTPYSNVPQDVTKVSLMGSLQDELGCTYDYSYECDNPALKFNENSGRWEGSFSLPPGCYTYFVKETFGCNNETFYGENGLEWGNEIYLFVPNEEEITFSYDPQSHTISSTPYFDTSTVNQCPEDVFINNTAGTCGAIVDYPDFIVTAYCGGDVISVSQTEGYPSGSEFPIGTTTNTFELVKTTGEMTTCSFDIVVTDTEPPVIENLNETFETLWPPNHRMVPVVIEYSVSDNCNVAVTELFVSSNEPETRPGKADKDADWEILDEHVVLLRAEGSGKDNREYYITIKVTDDSGNFTEQSVTITVSNDKGKISKKFTDSDYVLFPNGVTDVLHIKGPESSSNHSYVIYNMQGVVKKRGIIEKDQIEVNSLPSGVYILNFEMDKGYISKKFIKN